MYNRKQKALVWSCLVGIWLPCIAQATPDTTKSMQLGMAEFIELAMQQNFTSIQYQQRQTSQALALKLAEQRFIPKLSVASEMRREEKDQYSAAFIDNTTTGIDSNAQVNWLLPTGANLSVGYQYQEGKLTGLTSLGIPEDSQYNSTTTTSIEQPIIGGLWHNLNRLPQQKAQLQWQYYQTQGHTLTLQGQHKALQGFLGFQAKVDQIALLRQSLAYTKFRTNAVNERYQQGQTVLAELLQARLEQHQRQAALHKAQSELLLIQQELSAQLDQSPELRLKPLISLSQLLLCTGDGSTPPSHPTAHNVTSNQLAQHPEWQLSQLTERMAQLEYQTATFELWPQVSLFYNYNQAASQLKQNTSSQNWGLKASYAPFNTAGKLSKQQLYTAWRNASFDSTAKHQQLQQQQLLKMATGQSLQKQLQLVQEGVSLAQQAFNHAQTRFDLGVDSVLAVQQAQDSWLSQQQTELDAIQSLLSNRFDYYQAIGQPTPYQACDS